MTITAATVTAKSATQGGRAYTNFIYRDQDGRQIRKSPNRYFFTDGSSFSRKPKPGMVRIVEVDDAPDPLAAPVAPKLPKPLDEYAIVCDDEYVQELYVRSLRDAIGVAQSAAAFHAAKTWLFKNGHAIGTVAVDGWWVAA